MDFFITVLTYGPLVSFETIVVHVVTWIFGIAYVRKRWWKMSSSSKVLADIKL